jgi:hypothetical protein
VGTYAVKTPSPPRTGLKSLSGELRFALVEYTFSSSYTTGGEAFDPKTDSPGLFREILAVLPFQKGGYTFEWDSTAKKLKAYWGDYNNAADGVLIEVPAATNVGAAGALFGEDALALKAGRIALAVRDRKPVVVRLDETDGS